MSSTINSEEQLQYKLELFRSSRLKFCCICTSYNKLTTDVRQTGSLQQIHDKLLYHNFHKSILESSRSPQVARRYLRQGKTIRQVASPFSLCQRFPYAPYNAMVTKISK